MTGKAWISVSVRAEINNKKHNVMIKKNTYETPSAELFEVRFEENIMSPTWGGANQAGTVGDEDPDNTIDF